MVLARVVILVIGVPKLKCESLELESHFISIIHLPENLETLFPKTNDSRGSLYLYLAPGQTMTPGLFISGQHRR